MATTIKNADLFITERVEQNYAVPAEDLREFVGVFEPGTKVLFNNATAPLGWSNISDSNTNSTTLRIVKTGGGTTGGSGSFTTAYGSHSIKAPQHKHATSEGNHTHGTTLASHNHSLSDPGHTHTTSKGVTRAVHQHMTDVAPGENHPDNAMVAELGNADNNITPLHYSSIEEGDPSAAGPARAGVTVNNASVSFTSGNNNALNISVNNAGSTVTWDFRIKYNDFMICQKSPY